MKTLKTLAAVAALFVVCASGVSAQTLVDVKVAPAQAKVGEKVVATVNLEVTQGLNCGVRVNWGDGASTSDKINQNKDIPKIVDHQYAKPGTYTIKVEGKKVDESFKCSGKDKSTTVVIAAVPAPVVAAAPAAAAAPVVAKMADTCPAGWKLAKPGVNKKTMAYTCTAAANTKLPEPKAVCPGDLTYFENMKKGQFGCRV